jgi:hypothetical protein
VAAPKPAAAAGRPILPPDVPQYFAPGTGETWVPMLVGAARISYTDSKLGLDETNDVCVWTPIVDGPVAADWEHAEPANFGLDALTVAPPDEAAFGALPAAATKSKNYAAWTKAFSSWAGRTQSVELQKSATTGVVSAPGETEGEFRARVAHAAREKRDAAIAALRQKYVPKLAALDERIRKAGATIEKEQQQASDQKLSTAMSVGASVLGALFGRKAISATNVGRVATAARGVGRIGREAQDVERAKGNAAALVEQRAALNATLEEELQALQHEWNVEADTYLRVVVKPKRGGVMVQLVALAWRPE